MALQPVYARGMPRLPAVPHWLNPSHKPKTPARRDAGRAPV